MSLSSKHCFCDVSLTAVQIMVDRAIASNYLDMEGMARALPRHFPVGDHFTGASTFCQVMDALVNALKKRFPQQLDDFKASSILLFS